MTSRNYSKLSSHSPPKGSLELTDFTAVVPFNDSCREEYQPTLSSPPVTIHKILTRNPSMIHPDPISFTPPKGTNTPSIASDAPITEQNEKNLSNLYGYRKLCKVGYLSCGCASILVIIIVVVVIVRLTQIPSSSGSGSSDQASTNYVTTVVYTDSSCSSSSAIYQTAFPLDACLLYYMSGGTTNTYKYKNNQIDTSNPSNSTAYRYSDNKCTLSNLITYKATQYNQCTMMTKYPGYYTQTLYQYGAYSSIVTRSTSLTVIGFQDLTCRTITEWMNVQLLTCLPVTTTTFVRYSPDSSNGITKQTYRDSSCQGTATSTTTITQTGCVDMNIVNTVSPFRSKEVTDAFT